MHIKTNAEIGDYQMLLVLGEGRYSTVYKAVRAGECELVAIKCASKSKNLFSNTYIENEKKIVEKLRCHKNIVNHLGWFEDEKGVYFVMEYLNGYTLRREVAQSFLSSGSSDIPFSLKRSYLLQIIDGLKHLHSLNIYHCDLKPENIVIVDEVIKIVDFGCSIHSSVNLVSFKKKCINTTPGYGAPETIDFESPGLQVLLEGLDVWALGCVVYFLFTGITPFVQSTPYETLLCVKNIKIRLNILPQDIQNMCKGIFVTDIFSRLRLAEVRSLVEAFSE